MLAVTTSVTVAFLVPLGLVVRTVARDRALSEGEQAARTFAGVLAALGDPAQAGDVVRQFNTTSDTDVTLVLPDGALVGTAMPLPEAELRLARSGRAFTAAGGADRRIVAPVRVGDAVTVIVVAVPAALLTEGVYESWVALATVGLLLIGAGVALADRLARSTVGSIAALGDVTERLRAGDLDARVTPSGPPEVAAVGETLNQLAGRIDDLLVAERETLADLSHRVRTPLTALRLDVERVRSRPARERLAAGVERVADALTDFIDEARRPRSVEALEETDVGRVVRTRMQFWSVLAAEQQRDVTCRLPEGKVDVPVGEADVTAVVDALVGNVFQHTPPGTAIAVTVSGDAPSGAVLTVEDRGPGFRAEPMRGESRAGSSGLGLDIARRIAQRSGGSMAVERPATGGARVVVRFGPR